MMRNILIAVFLLISISTQAQNIVNGCLVTQVTPSDTDTISVDFKPFEFAWRAKITAKKDISIDWDKSSFIVNGQASKIAFEDSRVIDKNTPRAPEEVATDSYISRYLYPYEFVGLSMPTVSRRFTKQRFETTGKPDTVKIILSLIIDGNHVKQSYLFEIRPK